MLARLVEAGELPPLEQRLPNEPKLVNEMPESQVDYQIGTYGGTIRTVTSDVDWDADIFGLCNEPLINTPGMLGTEITGNIVKDYEVSDDQREFTFYLREGLKWSDGEPVTIEDFHFTFEDVLGNEELTPVFPAWLRSGGRPDGEPVQFDALDDMTFKLTFEEPYGGLLLRMAIQGWRSYTEILKPSHFLKQYHIEHTSLPDMAEEIDEEGFERGEWYNLFHQRDIINWELAQRRAIGFPSLQPWVIADANEAKSTFERNPYFYKVDEAGKQLPYIDYLESYRVQDAEMFSLKIIAGEVDFARATAVLLKLPIYKENAERNGYRVNLVSDHGTQNDIFVNLTYDDPVWREVVRNVRFREALNLAINRNEIADAVYLGFAERSPMNPDHFDPERAKQILDEIGLTVGKDGYRVGPDGKRFSIPFEIGGQISSQLEMAELITQMWQEVGLDAKFKVIDGSLWGQRVNANQLQATIIWTHSPLWWYGDMGQGFWAPLWNRWWQTSGQEGEEPPEDVKRFYRLMDRITVGSPEEGRATYQKIIEEMRENLWYFIPVGNIKVPLILNAGIRNVPDNEGFAMAINFSGEMMFYEE